MTKVKTDGLYYFLRQTQLHDKDSEEEKQVHFASLLHQEGPFICGEYIQICMGVMSGAFFYQKIGQGTEFLMVYARKI